NHACPHELLEIVRATSLDTGAGMPDAAERLHADLRACRTAIDIQISDPESALGQFNMRRQSRKHATRQAIVGIERNRQGVIERTRAQHRKDRTEDLLARQAMLRI